MSLVEAADVPPFIAGGYDSATLAAALSWASSQVEAYCEREFAYVEDDVVTVTPFRNRAALLPNPPVLSIGLVEAWLPRDGAMTWVEISNYQFNPDGLIYDTTGLPGVPHDEWPSWPLLPQSLRVTYTHGFEEIPQAVKDAVIKALTGYLTNPGNLVRKKIDDVEYAWSAANIQGAIDESLLSKYRLVSLA